MTDIARPRGNAVEPMPTEDCAVCDEDIVDAVLLSVSLPGQYDD